MQLKDLPDWSRRFGSLELSDGIVLRSAESSPLGHFAMLVIESKGVQALHCSRWVPVKLKKFFPCLMLRLDDPSMKSRYSK